MPVDEILVTNTSAEKLLKTLSSLENATEGLTEEQKKLTSTYNQLKNSVDHFESSLSKQFKQSQVVRDALQKLGKTEEELKKTTTDMIAVIFGEQMASKEIVKAFREQVRALEELKKKEESAILVGKILTFSTKSLSGQFASLTEGLSKVVGWKTAIGGAVGLSLGIKELSSTLSTYNRSVFETTQISSRYGESLSDIADGISLASQKTTLSKMAFADINKSFKEMYIGIPPTTKELAIFASNLQKNVGYSAEVTTKKMQDLLSIQSRMPDILERVNGVMKAYANNTGQGDKMTTALYVRMRGLGISAKEIRETMAMVRAPTAATSDLMKMEKGVADLEKAKQDAQLAIAQKTEPMLIGVNKATEILANSMARLNKITIMAVASLMGMATVLPILSSVGRGMGSMQNFIGAFMRASKILAGGGKTGGGISAITGMLGGISGGGGVGGGIQEGITEQKNLTIAAPTTPSELHLKRPETTPVEIVPKSMKGFRQATMESAEHMTKGVKSSVSGMYEKMGGARGIVSGAAGVATAGVIGYQIGKAINENVMAMFGKEGKLSDVIGDYLGEQFSQKKETAVEKTARAAGGDLRQMSGTLVAGGINTQGSGIGQMKFVDARKKMIEILKNETDAQKQLNVVSSLYNQGLLRSNELSGILETTITNRKDLDNKINEITKIGNGYLGNSTDIIANMSEQTDKVVTLLDAAAEQAGNLHDNLASAIDSMVELGVDPGLTNIGAALHVVGIKADQLAEAAGKRAAQGFVMLASEGGEMANVMKQVLPGQDAIIDSLAREEAQRKKLQVEYNKQSDNLGQLEASEKSASQEVVNLEKGVTEFQDSLGRGFHSNTEMKKYYAELQKKTDDLKAAKDKLTAIQGEKTTATSGADAASKALETQTEKAKGARKAMVDVAGAPSMEKQAEVIEIYNTKLVELQKRQKVVGQGSDEYNEITSSITALNNELETMLSKQAQADKALVSAAKSRMKEAGGAEDAQIKQVNATKSLRTAYMEAQKAYGLGPTASVVAMKQTSAAIEENIDLLEKQRAKQIEAAGKVYGEKIDFKKMGFDPEALLKSGKSVTQVIEIARKFGSEKLKLTRPEEIKKFNVEMTAMTDTINESLVSSARLMTENANLTKEMREGWLSANKEFIANAGVWSGIIPTMSRGITAFKEVGAQAFKETVGAAGTFGQRKPGAKRGRPLNAPVMSAERVDIANVENLGGEVSKQWSENTPLSTLEGLYASMRGQDNAESRRLGERIQQLQQEKIARTGGAGIVPIPSKNVGVNQSSTTASTAASWGKGAPNVTGGSLAPVFASGGSTQSGYVVSKAKTDQYKDLISMLNPAIVQGGIPGKDSVYDPSIGAMLMPGEAVVTGDEESDIAEMINTGQIDGMARGGTRRNRRKPSKKSDAIRMFANQSPARREKKTKSSVENQPKNYINTRMFGTKEYSNGGSFNSNTGIQIRHLAAGGGIQVPRRLAQQFASLPSPSGGGEVTLKLNPEVRDLLVADGRSNYRSGTRLP